MAPVTYFIRGRACSRWAQKKSRSDSPFSIRSYAPVAFRLVGEASTLGEVNTPHPQGKIAVSPSHECHDGSVTLALAVPRH